MQVTRFKKFLLDLLFPAICAGCRKADELVCAACLGTISRAELGCFICQQRNPTGSICPSCKKDAPYVDRAAWHTLYDQEIMGTMIKRFKYKKEAAFAPVLSSLMLPTAQVFLEKNAPRAKHPITMLPVPLHPKRLRERGFNQTELLANLLAERLRLPLLSSKTLQRRIHTPPQVSLPGRAERQKNLLNAFYVSNPGSVQDKIILLVDDVTTTGNTLNEAAKVLKQAGAQKVWGLVVAKG